MAVLDELATYLATELSLVVGVGIFKGSMPASPDTCVVVSEYGGSAAVLGFGNTTGVSIEYPHIQLRVRGAKQDYSTPRATADLARNALAQVQGEALSGTNYYIIQPLQSPFKLKSDEQERVIIAFNCAIEKEPS